VLDRGRALAAAADRPVVRMKLLGAQTSPALTGLDELPGKTNYFRGNDRTKWRAGSSRFARVQR
jgi:hypothetical protein